MEGKTEFSGIQIPQQPELNFGQNRETSLREQLSRLDNGNKGQQVLAHCLNEIYDNHKTIDSQAAGNTNVRYKPGSGNINIANQNDLLGPLYGIYDYQPVVDAIKNIPDPYNIFPVIETCFSQSQSQPNKEILFKTADLITNNTEIPVVIEKFDDSNDKWGKLDNGNIYRKNKSDANSYYGTRTDTYECSLENFERLISGDASLVDWSKPVGSVVLINELKSDDPETLKTCLHEIGHIVEKKYIIPEKEELLKDKTCIDTEVMSSLYGIKAALMMAEIDQIKATKMMMPQVELYNWVLTGTVAP